MGALYVSEFSYNKEMAPKKYLISLELTPEFQIMYVQLHSEQNYLEH